MVRTIVLAICVMTAMSVGDNQRDLDTARRVWARVVAAKGGESTLHALRNFVVVEAPGAGDRAAARLSVFVCSPPGRLWWFLDYRPGELGISTRVSDLGKQYEWYSHGGAAHPGLRPNADTPFNIAERQYLYFLETAYVQPKPIRVTEGRLDVVETEVMGRRVDFHIDRETHLPVRVERFVGTRRYVHTLTRYQSVGGILVPTRVGLGEDFVNAEIKINLDLDPALFSTAPDNVTTGDWWRKFLRAPRTAQ